MICNLFQLHLTSGPHYGLGWWPLVWCAVCYGSPQRTPRTAGKKGPRSACVRNRDGEPGRRSRGPSNLLQAVSTSNDSPGPLPHTVWCGEIPSISEQLSWVSLADLTSFQLLQSGCEHPWRAKESSQEGLTALEKLQALPEGFEKLLKQSKMALSTFQRLKIVLSSSKRLKMALSSSVMA